MRIERDGYAVAFAHSFETRIAMIRHFYAGGYVKPLGHIKMCGPLRRCCEGCWTDAPGQTKSDRSRPEGSKPWRQST